MIRFLIFLFFSFSASAQSFQDFINQLNSAPIAQRQAMVDSFMSTLSNTPFIENDTTAHFILQNQSATSVTNPGDHNFWDPNTLPLDNVPGTDFWYRSGNYEQNARIDYKFVVNGSSWILDPLNPNQVSGGFGPNSELAMPQYVQPWEIKAYPGVPAGTQIQEGFVSDTMNDTYQVTYLLPPNYDSTLGAGYPTVYFHDGLEYLSLGNARNVIMNLLDSGLIDPFIGVFVRPQDRNEEYAFSKRFRFKNFFIHELIPYVDNRFNTRNDNMERYMIGTSFGANISCLIGFNHQDVIMNLGLHSPAIWPNNYEAGDLMFSVGRTDMDMAAIWGSYEGTLHNTWVWGVDTMTYLGFNIYSNYYPEGHSWGLWRATIDELLINLIPNTISGLAGRLTAPSSIKAYPNPAKKALHIQGENIESVECYNLLGKTIPLKFESLGNTKTADIESIPAGNYFLKIDLGQSSEVIRWIKE